MNPNNNGDECQYFRLYPGGFPETTIFTVNPTGDRYSLFSVLLTFPFHLCVCMSIAQIIQIGI